VAHFVEIFGNRMGKPIEHVHLETMSALNAYEWPGNIRELQNLIERAVILSEDGVLPNPLSTAGTEGLALSPLRTTLSDFERNLILDTLETVGWVIGGANGAAAKLGLERTTLIKRMQKVGISRPPRPNVNVDNAATPGSEWMPGIYKLHERFPFRFSPTLSGRSIAMWTTYCYEAKRTLRHSAFGQAMPHQEALIQYVFFPINAEKIVMHDPQTCSRSD
jgi:hypothetical protein